MKRKSKIITNKNDIEYLLNLTENDITLSFMMKTFGEFENNVKFRPYDLITIPKDSYGPDKLRNKNDFVTTVGLWVFNKYFIEKDLFDLFQYINATLDSKLFKKINGDLSYALLEDKISLDQMKIYLMKTQKFMPFVSILSPSQSLEMLTCTKVIDKKKNELINGKYKEKLKGSDRDSAVDQIQDELISFAKDYLKDDPAMDSYNSGARGSFGNNFKNMFIMKGLIKDPNPTKGYNVAFSNYMDGISRDEYHIFANSLAAGPHKRAVKTAVGGYWEKQFVNGLQHVVLDAPGSDCGTNKTITVTITDKNKSMYMYCYVVEGSKLIELTSDVMPKYIGKSVKLRYVSLCKSKKGKCNKCAGNLFYRVGIRNVGLAAAILPSTLKNLSMKGFHDSSISTVEMDPMKAFGCE